MRIIAGEFRGRKLLPPKTETTRPITDRVKQSLFDILSPILDDAVVYDCFAGTGSMGLEALSRGARSALFFEADRSAATALRKNITALGVNNRSQVIASDLFEWFKSAKPTNLANLIFLDPPYRFLTERAADLCELAKRLATHLAPDGIVVFRHQLGNELPLPNLTPFDTRTYGQMRLELLHKLQ
jgi:16S rRNA (guanine966-N2)-methyltransferase